MESMDNFRERFEALEQRTDEVALSSETDLKVQVRDFWDAKSCGEIYASGGV